MEPIIGQHMQLGSSTKSSPLRSTTMRADRQRANPRPSKVVATTPRFTSKTVFRPFHSHPWWHISYFFARWASWLTCGSKPDIASISLETLHSDDNGATKVASHNSMIPRQIKGFVGGIRQVIPTVNDLTTVDFSYSASNFDEQSSLSPVATIQTLGLLPSQASSRQAEVGGSDLLQQVPNSNKSSSRLPHKALPSCGRFTQTALKAHAALKRKLSFRSQ